LEKKTKHPKFLNFGRLADFIGSSFQGIYSQNARKKKLPGNSWLGFGDSLDSHKQIFPRDPPKKVVPPRFCMTDGKAMAPPKRLDRR